MRVLVAHMGCPVGIFRLAGTAQGATYSGHEATPIGVTTVVQGPLSRRTTCIGEI